MSPECRYVEQNSGQTQYSFTVNLDSCGTQFINDFAGEAGQAYLENVLVLQVSSFHEDSIFIVDLPPYPIVIFVLSRCFFAE